MSQITLTHAAFAKAKSDVQLGSERLKKDRDSIDERVSGFLGSGWTGVAADSFVEGWEEWKAAAGDVLQGLVSMGELLDAVHQDFIQADDSSQNSLDQVSARVIDRLGG